MGLITDALEKFECAGVVAQSERFFLSRSVDFLEFLGQADHRDLAEAEFGKFGAGGVELAFTAIDQDQVGQSRLRVARANGCRRGVCHRRRRL